jgi:hypothetical protein
VLWRTISPFKQMTTWDSIFKGWPRSYL